MYRQVGAGGRRHAGRPAAATRWSIDPARRRRTCTSRPRPAACSRASDRAAVMGAAEQGRRGELPPRPLSGVRAGRPLHRARARPTPTGSASRTTAASIGSTGPSDGWDPHRRRRCRRRSATSASPSCRTRATRTPPGCSRWTAPTSGRGSSPGGRPAVYRTARRRRTAGERQDQRLPAEQGWFTVKRQAFCADTADPVGLYLGTTGGEVWIERRRGRALALDRRPPAGDLLGRRRASRMIRVFIPSQLHAYSGGESRLEARVTPSRRCSTTSTAASQV